MEVMHSLQRKGVEMTLVTNSLSANDSMLVNIGYARYRRPILRAGVRLYELGAQPAANGSQPFFSGSSRGRLHAKLMVIDQQVVLLGSLNLDPRSARRNTELGIAIDSPALAREALRLIEAMKNEAYAVRLESQGGALSWVSPDEDDDQGVDMRARGVAVVRAAAAAAAAAGARGSALSAPGAGFRPGPWP